MPATVPIIQVDAFTDHAFGGNPAAVCLLPAERSAAWMQAVAAEMNLSETAFLIESAGRYQLRWFTPSVEVDLCGHATLAAAHVLWSEGRVRPEQAIQFATRSGMLSATRAGQLIRLDFPLDPPAPAAPPAGLLEALGISAAQVERGRFDYLVEIESEDMLRGLAPDYARMAEVETRGVIVTARSRGGDFDFMSRFLHLAGIPEDPVTGSAHCCLAAYWSGRLARDAFVAYQASPRGGIVHVQVAGDRAILGGQAVTVLRGELLAADGG